MILSIKPLGTLHLSLRQIPSPSLRTSYEQETTLAPLPSTILGALGAALGVKLSGQNAEDYGLAELYEDLCDIFGSDFTIWGPLIKLYETDEYYIPVNEELCSLTHAEKYIENVQLKYQGLKIEEDELKRLQAWSTNKIGIRINPATKTVDEGYLYLTRLTSASKENFVEYLYELEGVGIEPRKTIVRLGGESRLAILELKKGDIPLSQEKRKYHILLSPCILSRSEEKSINVNNLTAKEGAKVERIYGRPELLGTGFSEVLKRRRPLMPQLRPGSVILFNIPERSRSWIGELTKYGFGSIIGIR